MEFEFESQEQADKVAEAAGLLAYRAAIPMGLGFLHYRPDDPQDAETIKPHVRPGKEVYMDYVSGRMVKLYIKVDGNRLITHDTPSYDYQSWCNKYPTYADLIGAAKELVGKGV